ncbi:MAG TPA: citrate lyase acyl carrier protein [Spirochaetia bacterium]|nr:citrate lyase acyl carrier protein [Spirochaetales bacterium]HRY79113.1 citrate lyase acyl carrier protein [Spirochaetia bacterium]HRZ89792.1 citrate lyase acyl carrier protein [Spirochaetia bacterium]
MKAKKEAMAGSLESSDVLVTIRPREGEGVECTIESIVLKQYGRRIRSVTEEVAAAAGLSGAAVRVQDRGALECTLRARLETAIERSTAGT